MTSSRRADRSPPDGAVTSLRERKKARTRQAIQEQALRLFADHGYEATTVEQIAEAAEVSPSTFFRYFRSKEDVVVRDGYESLFVVALASQPPDLAPLAAIRAAFRTAFEAMTPEEMARALARRKLSMSVPALRARTVERLLATIDMLALAVAERTGRDATDPAVRALVGAVLGVMVPAMRTWVERDGATPLPILLDEALGYLEAGLPV